MQFDAVRLHTRTTSIAHARNLHTVFKQLI